ncbi:class I SAM-dependent methyltransferase [Thiomicrorhabdus sp. zzn3]|uniref:class I SAM-dependent methyltransferase n=1 Tax=Thiomicrorhabdus sp. zzn3 TaxID=3039775 RepID=UPI002436BDC5|nr:class I SAM-dependent methyltransferase [Thiomicrorhabdus sp. zzn3]MDG6778515.1 class I SAM-dependent methyltransferase [Thiomicrorhabdus sp. zzn3]
MELKIAMSLSVCSQIYPDKAKVLSERLQLPLIATMPAQKALDNTLLLSWYREKNQTDDTPAKLGLFSAFSGPVSIDFTGGKKQHRRQFGGGKGQPLARAIGLGSYDAPSVLDATAGMGGDAFVFATLGCQVTMVERSPIVAALLEDALNRARQPVENADNPPEDQELKGIIQRLSLVNADAADYLLSQKPEVDVIYLDPMYPEKKKSASAKKEMKVLQHLLGPDLDSERLLDAALHTARLRVVVKRPAKAPTIAGIQPTAQINSPNTRYDLYSIKALKASGKLAD